MKLKSLVFILLICGFSGLVMAESVQEKDTVKVFQFEMKRQVDKGLWRITQRAFEESEEWGADLILIRMNTYGGLVDMADSIRTKILNYDVPVWVFIDNNAASAGALIAIACDSIYMRPGANIGAATVVDQQGNVVPDKFQSYMRSTMRSTAEAHGKDTLVSGGDTLLTWHRDPAIAEAMVDPSVFVADVVDTGKVLTFTTREAIQWGYCEGEAENVSEVLKMNGIEEYETKQYRLSGLEKFISLLLSPALQSILILLIVGGIYFELQTPGIGFPIVASIVGALLYFAPLYLEGLAENWEILIFVAGVALLLVEIFAIPGFGVAGIGGISLMISGLALSLVGNVMFDFSGIGFVPIFKSFAFVIFIFFISLLFAIWLSQKLLTSAPLGFLALQQVQKKDEGYVSVSSEMATLMGAEGEAYSILRPSGKVMIEGQIYDAVADSSWIQKGAKVKVVKQEATQIYVKEV